MMTNGSSLLLRELIGDGWARELTLFGRRLEADQALRIGPVTRVVDDPVAEATDMARDVTAAAQPAVSASKRLLNCASRPWEVLLDDDLRVLTEVLDTGEATRRLRSTGEHRAIR